MIGKFICGFYSAVFAGIVALAFWCGARLNDEDERLDAMREQVKKEGYHV